MRTIFPSTLKKIQNDSKYPNDWHWGAYKTFGPCGMELNIISSADYGWEHVSISVKNRCPNWKEMSFVKCLFWDENETVVQFHPPKKDYINAHPFVLHLWKPTNEKIPMPPKWMVGPYENWEKDIPEEMKDVQPNRAN